VDVGNLCVGVGTFAMLVLYRVVYHGINYHFAVCVEICRGVDRFVNTGRIPAVNE
jgi:hypothetical protein